MNPKLFLILIVALGNYEMAKLFQHGLNFVFPALPFTVAIVIPWLLLAIILVKGSPRESGLVFSAETVRKNILPVAAYSLLILAGLAIFVALGFNRHFDYVKYPILFFVFIPLIEELIFRGYIFRELKNLNIAPIIPSAVLFGLHHLQYENYHLSGFLLFQIGYTMAIGLILGKIREKSGSLYIGFFLHAVLNFVTLQ